MQARRALGVAARHQFCLGALGHGLLEVGDHTVDAVGGAAGGVEVAEESCAVVDALRGDVGGAVDGLEACLELWADDVALSGMLVNGEENGRLIVGKRTMLPPSEVPRAKTKVTAAQLPLARPLASSESWRFMTGRPGAAETKAARAEVRRTEDFMLTSVEE